MNRFALVLVGMLPLWGQSFSQRGFIETRGSFFPQTTPSDSGRAIGDVLLRYEMAYKLTPWLKFNGAIDGRTDTHRQTERQWRVDWQDRGMLRPAVSLRRFSLTANKGKWTVEAGKQFIRWGKADILNPLDRFAPRDFLNVVDTEYLAVMAGRATWESGGETIDLVWQPRFTPSRSPLLLQRWGGLGGGGLGGDLTQLPLTVRRGPAVLPTGQQWGVRWNHVGRGYEAAGVYYEGHNHLPLLEGRISTFPDFKLELYNYFAKLRMVGGATAIPNRWFTLKGEGGYFSSSTPAADNYFQYVIQAERQSGEWTFVGGYAGEYVTVKRNLFDFAPDRGLTRSFLGRASLQVNPRDTVAFDFALRQNGDGVWVRGEYAHSFNDHWSARVGGSLIRGRATDFLGQFGRNSHVTFAFRYSF
ncbi:MAG: hypothetical protein NTV52_23775 [Acidobacteria bacterium]|nr:hypothetical protein [Acidobacteriota bacterium]